MKKGANHRSNIQPSLTGGPLWEARAKHCARQSAQGPETDSNTAVVQKRRDGATHGGAKFVSFCFVSSRFPNSIVFELGYNLF